MGRSGTRRLAAAAATAAALLGSAATAATATAAPAIHRIALRAPLLPSATVDPALNIPPSPDYWGTCLTSGANSSACIDAVLTAINGARALEGVPPMVLPAGFASLAPAVQTFVVSNLERIDRGLQPATGMVDSLNATSQTAAVADADPVLSGWTVGPFSANRWGSIWAGDLNALAADYDWMYNDGWGPTGSYNLDCTSATSSGCWVHRHNILSSYGDQEVITGVGSVQQSQWLSIAQLFVAGTGAYPTFTHAWSEFAPTGGTSSGPAPTPTPTSGGSSPLAAGATTASLAAPSTAVSGTAARVVGHVSDMTTKAPIAGVAVRVCSRAAGATTASCTTARTDAAGAVVLTAHPRVTTSYWLTFAGTTGHAAASSTIRLVRVRPAVRLRSTRTGSTWQLTAQLSPVRRQVVRLQRSTATGWVTVRRVPARTWLSFTSLRRGTYRLTVSATSATGAVTATTRLR
jgi:5-hydroxyisourate hydrolase-like protein (transthyretin family)